MNIKVLASKILSLFFPKICFFCNLPGTNLCAPCKKDKFIGFVKNNCHVCNGLLRNPQVYVHQPCRKRTSLDGVFASYVLNPQLKKYISTIKYSFYTSLFSELALDIRAALANRCFVYDLITWVPLHPFRQNWRGFNQAELIAKAITFKALPLLTKTQATKQQAHLTKAVRSKNLAGVFKCNSKLVNSKSILLCDDVYTTGSTLESCAFTLKKAGASKVYAYVLAQDLLKADAAIIEALSKR